MNKTFIKLLLIEDNQADVVLLQVTLERDPHIKYLITAVDHLNAGIQKIHETHFDVVLLDLGLPDSQGLDTFQQVHAVDANLPIVVLSGLMDEELALQAVHLGAQDYVVKGTTGWDSLSRLIRYAMERKQAQQALLDGESRFRILFESSPVAIWEEDFSQVKHYIEALQQRGVSDLDAYFSEHIEALAECIQLVQVQDVNQAALLQYEAASKAELLGGLEKTFPPEALIGFKNELLVIAKGEAGFQAETTVLTFKGHIRNVAINWAVARGYEQNYSKVLISLTDITDRKQAEEKLRQSEEDYHYLFDNNPLPMWAFDQETLAFLAVNDAAIKKYGYSRAEFLSMTIADIRPPEDREHLRQSREYPHPYMYHSDKWRHKLKNGQIIDVEITSHQLTLNNHAAMLVVAQDITERKQAEEKLFKSEARFASFFENSPVAMGIARLSDRKITHINHAFAELFGFSPEEALGYTTAELNIWENPAERDRFITLLQNEKHVRGFEAVARLKSGEIRYVIVSGELIDSDNEPSLLAQIVDITDRKQAEIAVRTSEQRFRALIENGLDYISLLDGEGNLLWESPSSRTMLGFNFNQYVGRNIFELMHPEDLEWTSKQFAELAHQPGHRITGIFRLQRSDGSWRWVEAIASNFLADPSVEAIVINYRDITERKQAELELQQRNADLGIVNAMNAALIRGESLHNVIDILADGLMGNFACQGTNVYLWDAGAQSLALQHYLLQPELQHQIEEAIGSTIPLMHISPKADGWLQQSLNSQQGLLLNEPESIREWLTEFWEALAATRVANSAEPQSAPNLALDIQSAILMPLISGDQVIGLLDLTSAKQLSQNDLPRIENLSRQLTAAIQRQQADERVRRSEEFLNSVQNALSAHMAILDHQGNIVQINAAWRKFAEQNGYAHPRYGVGVNYLEICDTATGISAEGAEEVATLIRQVLAGTKREAWVEYPCHSPTEKRWFVLRITRFINGNQIWVVLAHENITERKQAEEAIQRSQSILTQAGTMAHLGAWEIEVSNPEDINSNPARWSDEVYRILGYKPGEVEAGNELFVERVHPQDREKISDAMQQAVRWNKPYAVEHRIIQPNGTVRIVEEHANLIYDEHGQLTHILGAVQDITEHKQIEETLKRTSEQFRVLFEASPEAVMLIDPHDDWLIVDCNDAACLMNGYSRSELIGQPINILNLTPGDAAGRLEYLESIRASGVLRFDHLHRHKDGSVFPITTSTSLIQFGDRELVLGIDRDITERKQAEEALREAKNYAENLIQTANVIVLGLDRNGSLQVFNQAAQDITGYTLNELADKDYFEVLVPRDRYPEVWQEFQRLTSGGIPRNFEKPILTKSGEERIISWQNSVVTDSADQITGTVSFGVDITESKHMEEALRLSAEENQAIINAVPDLLFRVDQAGVIVGYHARDENDLYVAPENFLGKTVSEVLPPSVSQTALAMFAEALATNQAQAFEYELSMHGTSKYYEDRVVPLSNNEILSIIRDITERKQAEQALQESREQYRNLVDQLPVIVYTDHLVEGVGVTHFMSPQIESITGFSIQEWLSGGFEGWKQQIHPQDRERVITQYLHCLSNGEPFEAEYRLQTKSGQWIWMHDQFKVVLDAQNHPVSSHGIMYDITERKQTEQALLDSEERYRTLVNQLPAIVYVDKLVDTTGVTEYVSPQIENICGFKPEEWLAGGFELWKAQIHSEDRERVLAEYQQCLATAQAFECEYRIRTKTGRIIWLHDQSKVIVDAQNQPVSVHGISYDITERKQAEQALQESEERYRSLVQNTLEGMGRATLDGHMLAANPALVRLNGYGTEAELIAAVNDISREWYVNPNRRAELLNILDMYGEVENFESEIYRHKTQERIWISESARLVRDADGQPLWVEATIQDITERKQAEAERQHRVAELEALYENGLAISSLLDPKLISDKVVEVLAQKLHWHHAAIRLFHSKTNQLELVSLNHPGLTESQLHEQIARLNSLISDPTKGLTGWVIKQRLPLHSGDLLSDPRYTETYMGMRSGLYVPILAGERVLGAISVESELANAFTEQDERLLQTLANQAAVAIENAQLYLIVQKELDERQQAEQRLRESEARQNGIIESAMDAIISVDETQHIVLFNAAAEKIFGYPVEEALGQPLERFIPERFRTAHHNHIKNFGETGVTKRGMNSLGAVMGVHADGSEFPIEASISQITVAGVKLYTVILRDITERKQAETDLRRSEEKYRLLAAELETRVLERTAEVQDLYNNAPCGYHSLDANGNFTRINETELQWLGYSREEILNQPFVNFLTPESRVVFSESFPVFKKEGAVKDLEFDLVRKSGTTFPILVSATAMYDKQNNYVSSRSTLFDNTERKSALETLRLANTEMKRALRTKDEFLANMSHELRTPLNAILGLSESLLEQTAGTLNEKQLRYLTTINESGTHLLELINDILDLAKVEAGQIKLDPGKVDINNICQASYRIIKQLAQKKDQKVEINIESNIGFIWADERRLKQMLVNLLSNAVKFTPVGAHLGLNAQIDYKESKLLLSVWDNGIGIREEDLPRLFKPFVQLDSSLSRESSGTGLGLALVAQMARLHGGSISVSSVPGQGSRFTIVLPWDPALTTETLEKMKVTGRFPVIKSLPGKPKTILLVEDTDSVVMLVRDYLELSGYNVELARDGIAGVSKALASQPDLILMDVQMPGMDGFEATRRIRQEPTLRHTPIIALTALAMANDRERCLEAGMNDYLSKPVNLRQLVKIIQSYISNPGIGDAV